MTLHDLRYPNCIDKSDVDTGESYSCFFEAYARTRIFQSAFTPSNQLTRERLSYAYKNRSYALKHGGVSSLNNELLMPFTLYNPDEKYFPYAMPTINDTGDGYDQ